jgi:hypothetical protein
MEDKPKYDASIHHRRSIRLKATIIRVGDCTL